MHYPDPGLLQTSKKKRTTRFGLEKCSLHLHVHCGGFVAQGLVMATIKYASACPCSGSAV